MSKKLFWLIIIYVVTAPGILLMNDESSVQTVLIMTAIWAPVCIGIFIYERKTGKR